MYSQKIDDILTKPYSLWIISVIIAIGLWTFVIGVEAEGETSITISSTVDYVNVAPQLEMKDRVNEVWVDVSGAKNDVDNLLNEKNISCVVDVRELTDGRYRLPIDVTLPQGIKLRGTRPSQVAVNLMRYVERLMDIQLNLPHDIQEGFYLDSVEIIPKQVTIKGTEKDLARIGRIMISPTMENLRSGKELFLPPEFESSESFEEDVRIEPKQIRLKSVLVSGSPSRMIPVSVRMSGTPDMDYAVLSTTVMPAEVLVEGPKEILDKLVSIETGTVDITGIKESTSMVVSIRPPMNRSIKVVGVGTVRISVNLQPVSATKEIANIPVKIEGGGQIAWKAVPSSVTVTIEGLPSDINSQAAESLDIVAFVNTENMFSNQSAIPVRARIDSSLFRVTKVNPYIISILNEP